MAHTSHADMTSDLCQFLGNTIGELQTIWDHIGICDEQRTERTNVVFVHLRNLLEEMLKEERSLKKGLEENVERYSKELNKLSEELGVQSEQPKSGLSLIKLEKHIRDHADALAKEKHDRIKVLKRLRSQDQHLCDVLCTTPYYVPSGSVPTKSQLEELRNHVTKRSAEKDQRHNVFLETKKEIIELLEDLEQQPNSSFEQEIVCEEENSFLLSAENMETLKKLYKELEMKQKQLIALATELRERMVLLWDRLEIPSEERNAFSRLHRGYKPVVIKAIKSELSRLEILKLQNIQRFVEGMRSELKEWWERCYFSVEQRKRFVPFTDDQYTEELLEIHDREVQRMKHYYVENKDMLEKVAKREKLWCDFLEFEKRATDPNRFSNRGGGLLQEEKARKKLMVQLPKLEHELEGVIIAWEKENNRQFRVHDQRFVDYVKRQWEDYEVQKESEKQQRHKAKAKLMEEEMIYGSKPNTPAKRRFIGTPSKTPTKVRKLNINDTTKTPMSATMRSAGRVHHSTVMPSPAPPRPPKSTTKTPRNLRPTNSRMTRRALADRNAGNGKDDTLFSHTTLSSGGGSAHRGSNSSVLSIPAAASYQDFAVSDRGVGYRTTTVLSKIR